MKKALVIAVALMLSVSLYAQSGEQNIVVVTGQASREITPDKFTIEIRLAESDSKGRITLQEQEASIIKALKRVNINTQEQLRLADNTSDYFRRGEALASRIYELTLNSNKELFAAFEALQPLGLHSISLTKAVCTTADAIREELRREAIIDARQRATTLATAIGQNIGSCTYIADYYHSSEQNFAYGTYKRRLESAAMNDAIAIEQESSEFTKERIDYSVQAKFELLPLER